MDRRWEEEALQVHMCISLILGQLGICQTLKVFFYEDKIQLSRMLGDALILQPTLYTSEAFFARKEQ